MVVYYKITICEKKNIYIKFSVANNFKCFIKNYKIIRFRFKTYLARHEWNE